MAHTLEIFWDFSSPFSYLASTQADALAARTGATLVWKPMLLGGLFKSIGQVEAPVLTWGEAKRTHTLKDLHRWAELYGVPFAFPSRFPMNSLKAMRAYLALPEDRRRAYRERTYRAYWAEDRDISDDATLRELIGDGAEETLVRTQQSEIKKALIDATNEAVTRGVFGAPTWVVDGGESDLGSRPHPDRRTRAREVGNRVAFYAVGGFTMRAWICTSLVLFLACGGSTDTTDDGGTDDSGGNPDVTVGPDTGPGDDGGTTDGNDTDADDGGTVDAGPFDPSSLGTNLVLWLEGDKGVTEDTNNAGHVQTWADQTSYHNDATGGTGNGAHQPTVNATAINGLPGVEFALPQAQNQPSQYLIVPDSASLQLGAGDFAIFMVAQYSNASTGNGASQGIFYYKVAGNNTPTGPEFLGNAGGANNTIESRIRARLTGTDNVNSAATGFNDGNVPPHRHAAERPGARGLGRRRESPRSRPTPARPATSARPAPTSTSAQPPAAATRHPAPRRRHRRSPRGQRHASPTPTSQARRLFQDEVRPLDATLPLGESSVALTRFSPVPVFLSCPSNLLFPLPTLISSARSGSRRASPRSPAEPRATARRPPRRPSSGRAPWRPSRDRRS